MDNDRNRNVPGVQLQKEIQLGCQRAECLLEQVGMQMSQKRRALVQVPVQETALQIKNEFMYIRSDVQSRHTIRIVN